jgi:hypothetical protein
MNDEQHKRLYRIFECVMGEVWSAGGDGDGDVVFGMTDIREVAAAFEEWQAQHPIQSKWPLKRHDISNEHVFFSDQSNENVTFISKKAFGAGPGHGWTHDIVMEVW